MQTDRNCSQPEITFLFHTHKYRSGVRTSFFYSRSLQAIYDFFLSRWKQKTLFATHRFCNASFSQSGFWIMRQLFTKKKNTKSELKWWNRSANISTSVQFTTSKCFFFGMVRREMNVIHKMPGMNGNNVLFSLWLTTCEFCQSLSELRLPEARGSVRMEIIFRFL